MNTQSGAGVVLTSNCYDSHCQVDVFRGQGFLCDVNILSHDDKIIKAHGVVLAASSPVICQMLSNKSLPITISVPAVQSCTWNLLLRFIYTNQIAVADLTEMPGNLQSLYNAAVWLKVMRLIKLLESHQGIIQQFNLVFPYQQQYGVTLSSDSEVMSLNTDFSATTTKPEIMIPNTAKSKCKRICRFCKKCFYSRLELLDHVIEVCTKLHHHRHIQTRSSSAKVSTSKARNKKDITILTNVRHKPFKQSVSLHHDPTPLSTNSYHQLSELTPLSTNLNHQLTPLSTNSHHQPTSLSTNSHHQLTPFSTNSNHQPTPFSTNSYHQPTSLSTDSHNQLTQLSTNSHHQLTTFSAKSDHQSPLSTNLQHQLTPLSTHSYHQSTPLSARLYHQLTNESSISHHPLIAPSVDINHQPILMTNNHYHQQSEILLSNESVKNQCTEGYGKPAEVYGKPSDHQDSEMYGKPIKANHQGAEAYGQPSDHQGVGVYDKPNDYVEVYDKQSDHQIYGYHLPNKPDDKNTEMKKKQMKLNKRKLFQFVKSNGKKKANKNDTNATDKKYRNVTLYKKPMKYTCINEKCCARFNKLQDYTTHLKSCLTGGRYKDPVKNVKKTGDYYTLCNYGTPTCTAVAFDKSYVRFPRFTLVENVLEFRNKIHKQHYKCGHCNQRESGMRRIVDHVANVHCKIKPFVCQTCHKGFSGLQEIKDHYLRFHGNKSRYECNVCREKFKCRTTLWLHKRNEHVLNEQGWLLIVLGRAVEKD